MSRAVVVLLTLLIVAAGVLPGESDARRRKSKAPRTIVVRDFTSDAWTGVVAQTVADFNAVMSEGGPTLIYQREAVADCDTMRLNPERGIIKVCSFWRDGYDQGTAQRYSNIRVNDWYATDDWYRQFRPVTICHEMMHILTKETDYYRQPWYEGEAIDHTGYPFPDTSCLWGALSHPGSKDIELLEQAYGRTRR